MTNDYEFAERRGYVALYLFASCLLSSAVAAEVIHVPAFDLQKYSEYLSPETRIGIENDQMRADEARKLCDPWKEVTGAKIRACERRMYEPIMADARKKYDVKIEEHKLGGVTVDIVTPSGGLPERNRDRVLLNVHGGGFKYGARFGGQLESMPVAAIGKLKVVAIDYRMAPEHQFPAASTDVASVYQAMLREYEPTSIGLFGCSAGGRIVGQTVAWLAEHGVPRPGAVAILCSPPMNFGGDSNVIAAAIDGRAPLQRRFDEGYFKGAGPGDPLAFPGDFDSMLIRFPPTLLVTSTRDPSLSPMVKMHSRLVALGIPSELHVFEGLGHAQFLSFSIPEARHAATVVARFFDLHLSNLARTDVRLHTSNPSSGATCRLGQTDGERC